jgi:hypothetical protein
MASRPSQRARVRELIGAFSFSPHWEEDVRSYSVYVIELDEAVWSCPKFRNENPRRDPHRPCAYVGMTGRTPEVRFSQHREGYKANRFVAEYGVRLLTGEGSTELTWEEAQLEEVGTAERLRREGWGVYQR